MHYKMTGLLFKRRIALLTGASLSSSVEIAIDDLVHDSFHHLRHRWRVVIRQVIWHVPILEYPLEPRAQLTRAVTFPCVNGIENTERFKIQHW
jgi:hypothetical protein